MGSLLWIAAVYTGMEEKGRPPDADPPAVPVLRKIRMTQAKIILKHMMEKSQSVRREMPTQPVRREMPTQPVRRETSTQSEGQGRVNLQMGQVEMMIMNTKVMDTSATTQRPHNQAQQLFAIEMAVDG